VKKSMGRLFLDNIR